MLIYSHYVSSRNISGYSVNSSCYWRCEGPNGTKVFFSSQLNTVYGIILNYSTAIHYSVNRFDSAHWERNFIIPIPEDAVVKAVFALKHNPEVMKQFEIDLLDKSTPTSGNYGKWLSKKELIEITAPPSLNIKRVTDFLESYGVKDFKISELRDIISVSIPVKVAEKMLDTEFAEYKSKIDPKVVLLRITKPYHLPPDIAEVVAIVDDIMRFPSIKQPRIISSGEPYGATNPEFQSCSAKAPKCAENTTPDVLEKAYSFSALSSYTTGNSVSVAEFQFQYWDQTDITSFNNACNASAAVASTVGGNNPNVCLAGGCIEALLDIEYIGAVSAPIPLLVYYQQDYSLLNWVNGVMTLASPPLVNSVSYGNDEVQQTSAEYMYTCDTQFQKAASLGLSILFASGDQGVWGRSGVGATFHPDFPASSPYITSIGGTNFLVKSTIGEETTWDCGGGGFSDTFPVPSWQKTIVQNYLSTADAKKLLPDYSLFNETGRAYPDLAALGGQTNPYCVAYSGGSFGGVAGTSASCPVVAGIIAQLNDLRLKAGKTSLGWLNPSIYSTWSAAGCFNDIKDESKNNCIVNTPGFAALDGWDPATGFGSPNYKCLAGLM